MKKKAMFVTISLVVVCIVLGLISIAFTSNTENELSTEDVVLNGNVSVVTNETSESEQPYKIDENHLYYKTKPDLKKNEVVVSGITESAPSGFMRKVVKVKKINDEYVVETTPASFTDVFKEVNFEGCVNLEEDTASPAIEPQGNYLSPVIAPLSKDVKSEMWYKIKNRRIVGENFDANVSAEFDLKLLPKLQVTNGNISFDMLWDNTIDAHIDFCNYTDINESAETHLSKHTLHPQEIYIGNVPVVIANEVNTYFRVEGEIKGDLSAGIDMNDEIIQGFHYISDESSYNQNDTSKEIENNTELLVGGPVTSDIDLGIYVKSTTQIYDGLSVENLSGLKATVTGDMKVENSRKSEKAERNGEIDITISADNEVTFIPDEPLCKSESENPIVFERQDDYLWNRTTVFEDPVAPGEASISRHFYDAFYFFQDNIYGRKNPVMVQNSENPPIDGCIEFEGEWLAPNKNFVSYDDFIEQCSQYFEDETIEAIEVSIRSEDYKNEFYSRFPYGIGDFILGNTYKASINEIKLDEYTYYYIIKISFEDISGKQVNHQMYCNYVNGKWLFDHCAFYGINGD